MINSYTATIFKTAILKYDVSDHFPICLIIPSSKFSSKNEHIYILIFTEQSIINFKKNVFEIDWQEIKALQNPWNAYTYFLEQFLRLYDRDKKKSREKLCKDLQNPWITNGVKKSSKHKQRLYDNFLKNGNEK